MFGISLWKLTLPALPTPPALQDQEAEIEKDLDSGAVEEEVVAAAVEEEWGLLARPTVICLPSWAT